jgi:hypothetical protein
MRVQVFDDLLVIGQQLFRIGHLANSSPAGRQRTHTGFVAAQP